MILEEKLEKLLALDLWVSKQSCCNVCGDCIPCEAVTVLRAIDHVA